MYTTYTKKCTPYTTNMARIDRDAVLEAALDLGDNEGLEAITLRRLAELLGVTPMALYRHVAGKEELLDGLAELLYAELELPEPHGDWWAELTALARSTRRTLVAHPWAVPLFARPLSGPHGEALDDALEATLLGAGFTQRDARELHDQLSAMVFALVGPELRGKPNRAAFERGVELLRPGLDARRQQE